MKLSVFRDRSGATIDPLEDTWEGVCARLASPPDVADKAQAVLFSLCEFGDKRTERGSLRSNDNVVQVWGACGDYDGEKVSPDFAAGRLRELGVRAFVYTSPSHREDAPRWRVVLPFDTAAGHDEHTAAVEKLNGIVGGGLSSESFTLSQPYYIGRVAGGVFKSWKIDGRDIRGLDIPRLPWRGAQSSNGSYRTDTATLVGELEAGQEVHPAIVALAMRGFTREELEDIVRRGASGWERPERADVACDQDIPRAVESAARKREGDLARKLAGMPIPPKPEQSIAEGLTVPVGSLMNRTVGVTWLVRDIMEHPTNVIMFGESGVGKSFVSISMACCVAHGIPWYGHKVKQGRVLYIAGEGFAGVRRRFKAWHMHNGVPPERWADVPISVTRHAIDFNGAEDQQRLIDDIKRYPTPPDLVFIDTVHRMTPGMDENSSKDVGTFIRNMDDLREQFGCTVVGIHHTGNFEKGRMRGSSALKGALDVEMSVSKTKSKAVISLTSTKMKDGEEFAPKYFKFQTFELPDLENADEPGEMPRRVKTAVLIETEKPGDADTGEKPSKAVQILRETLQGGPLDKRTALDNFKRLYGGVGDTGKKAFHRALKGAVESGLVVLDPETEEYRLALG